MKFGIDDAGVRVLSDQGVRPDYGLLWTGAWNVGKWDGVRASVQAIADQGVVPVVEWFYWGNDISRDCVLNGCWSSIHNTWKSQDGWNSGARNLAAALHNGLHGRQAVVVIETEFNKNDIPGWETFDGMLVTHAGLFRSAAPEVKLALGFGNWGSTTWGTFDRAVGAMDYTGLQLMRGSTRDSAASYDGAVDAVVSGARALQSRFAKPVLLHDIALSTYPEPDYAYHQEAVVRKLFTRLPDLASAGVVGVVYRGLTDAPNANTAEYYGEAERHFGLRHADGTWKPALDDWLQGIRDARAGTTPSSTPTGTATFEPRASGNDWWVEAAVTSAKGVSAVSAQVNGGSWVGLSHTDWGTWAKSLNAPDGARVQFRAQLGDGATALSSAYTWGGTNTFSATFEPRAVGNDWWVEAKVTSGHALASVAAQVDNGAWVGLDATDWGTWAKSIHAPGGSQVRFRATDTAGATALSNVVTW